jgi:hypothetical protein
MNGSAAAELQTGQDMLRSSSLGIIFAISADDGLT